MQKYELLIEYPEKNVEDKQSLMYFLNKIMATSVLVDLPELYHYGLIKEASKRQHLSSFWNRIKAFHISDIEAIFTIWL